MGRIHTETDCIMLPEKYNAFAKYHRLPDVIPSVGISLGKGNLLFAWTSVLSQQVAGKSDNSFVN